MPIYLMSIRVLLSVELCVTLKTYLKGAPFYNAWESRGVCGISKRGGKVGFLTFPARVFSTARRADIFSAACDHVIFLAIARKMPPLLSLPAPSRSSSKRTYCPCSPTSPQSGHFMCYLNRTFHGSTTLAVSLACSRGASCDSPAARGGPLGEWAAFVSWPWPPWVLRPELEQGLESPPKPRPYRDSESVVAHPPIRTP